MTTRTRTSWIPMALLALLAPACIGMGIWQLHRADYKRGLQQEYDRHAVEAPRPLGPVLWSAQEALFRHVIVHGTYEPDYQILLDNRVLHGQPGYEVLTPMRIDDSDMRVLVNRGWVPLGPSRTRLPDIQTPPGTQTLMGVTVVPPDKYFSLGGPVAPAHPGWEPVWQQLDVKRYAASVPFVLQPMIVRLDPDMPTGFARDWPRPDVGLLVHQAYAVQWFAFALLTLAALVVMLRRSRRTASRAVSQRRKNRDRK